MGKGVNNPAWIAQNASVECVCVYVCPGWTRQTVQHKEKISDQASVCARREDKKLKYLEKSEAVVVQRSEFAFYSWINGQPMERSKMRRPNLPQFPGAHSDVQNSCQVVKHLSLQWNSQPVAGKKHRHNVSPILSHHMPHMSHNSLFIRTASQYCLSCCPY